MVIKGLDKKIDSAEILSLIDKVLAENTQSVTDYKNGKDRAIGFLVGQTMRATKGQGNPQLLNKLIKEELDRR